VFRRTPPAPNPYADLLTGEAEASTEVFDRVPADTAELPPVPEGPSVTTGPATVVYSALEVTRDDPAPEVPRPAPHRPGTRSRTHRRPHTTRTWWSTLHEVRRDPMTAIYVIIIAVAAAATCWGTMVAFRPEWVPPALNPRPAAKPSVQPAQYRPPRREPTVRPSVPQPPQDGPQEPEPSPSRTKRPKAVQEPTRTPQSPSESPSPQSPPPSRTPSESPSETPTETPSESGDPTPSDPTPPETKSPDDPTPPASSAATPEKPTGSPT
jgi:hypothetical protein